MWIAGVCIYKLHDFNIVCAHTPEYQIYQISYKHCNNLHLVWKHPPADLEVFYLFIYLTAYFEGKELQMGKILQTESTVFIFIKTRIYECKGNLFFSFKAREEKKKYVLKFNIQ